MSKLPERESNTLFHNRISQQYNRFYVAERKWRKPMSLQKRQLFSSCAMIKIFQGLPPELKHFPWGDNCLRSNHRVKAYIALRIEFWSHSADFLISMKLLLHMKSGFHYNTYQAGVLLQITCKLFFFPKFLFPVFAELLMRKNRSEH